MFGEIAAALAGGHALALVTVVRTHGAAPCAPGTRLVVRADGHSSGSLGGASTDARARADALRVLQTGQPLMQTYTIDAESGESVGSCGATLEVFVEPLRPEPRLVVAGSGYVAQALARLMVPLGWRVTLLDDRAEFLASAALPEGVQSAMGDLAALLGEQAPDAQTAVVVLTRGHRADAEALHAALRSAAGYIGMIGSLSKVRAIYRRLLNAGVHEEALTQVHAPIGLDLHAETPDEIALSIAAELLQWRRGGTGRPLREVHAPLAAPTPDAQSPASAQG